MKSTLAIIVSELRQGLPLLKSRALVITNELPPLVQNVINQSTTEYLNADQRQQVMQSFDMSSWLSRQEVTNVKERYTGRTIKLIKMFDNYSVKAGTLGVVDMVDDAGQLSMKWEDNRTLSVNFDAGDLVEIINA